jgi:CDGSH-type Zn-finger protein
VRAVVPDRAAPTPRWLAAPEALAPPRKRRDYRAVTPVLGAVQYNETMRAKLTRNLSAAVILAVACAVALCACGSSSKKPAADRGGNALIAFSTCMRANGVPNFPDPSGAGGLNIAGTGINPQAPAFESAQAACVKLMPGGGPGTHATAQQIKDATETAECMRNHGVSGFPDPLITDTPPAINPGEYSTAEYGNGMFTGIPSSIDVNSPAFEAAAKTCNLP